jgi:hypothetical protein
MKKIIILIFMLFVNIYVYSQKAIPKSVSDDFTYSVFENYKYGNGNIKMLLMTKLRQQGYSPMNVDVLMETIDKNVKNRNKVIEAIHSVIGDNEEFMYANLSSLGMSATNAKYMTQYILNEDYKVQPTEKELQEIKNKKINAFNLEKENRKNEYNNLTNRIIKREIPISRINSTLNLDNEEYGLPQNLEANINENLVIKKDNLLELFNFLKVNGKISFIFNLDSKIDQIKNSNNEIIQLSEEQKNRTNEVIKLKNPVKIKFKDKFYSVKFETDKFDFEKSTEIKTVSFFFRIIDENKENTSFFASQKLKLSLTETKEELNDLNYRKNQLNEYEYSDFVKTKSSFFEKLILEELYKSFENKNWKQIPSGTNYNKFNSFKYHFAKGKKNEIKFQNPCLYSISFEAEINTNNIILKNDNEEKLVEDFNINENSYKFLRIKALNQNRMGRENNLLTLE